MYALLITFTLGLGMRSTAEKLADQFAPAHRTAKGFKSQTFLGDDTDDEEARLVQFFKDQGLKVYKPDVEAFRKIAKPQLEKALSGIVKGPPSIRLFEVYEPKA